MGKEAKGQLRKMLCVSYHKWLGTAFQQLACAETLTPIFHHVLDAQNWPEREQGMTAAYEYIAEQHNRLSITAPLPTRVSPFYERPFLIIHADRFAEAIRGAITSPEVLALPPSLGGIDQFVDSTDVLSDPQWFERLRPLYASEDGDP